MLRRPYSLKIPIRNCVYLTTKQVPCLVTTTCPTVLPTKGTPVLPPTALIAPTWWGELF